MAQIAHNHLCSIDFSDADVVVVPGFGHANDVLKHPTCRPDTRVVVADFHMLDDVDAIRGNWDRVVVHSCFPRFAHVYRTKHVPLNRVLWRPYPVHVPHYVPNRAAIDSDGMFAGGRHRRADALLVEAASRLPKNTRKIRFFTNSYTEPTGPLVPEPTVEFGDFLSRLAQSRVAIVPLDPSPRHAAGITGVALAQAMGRPVIATASGGTVDHCRHEIDALLVQPGDAAALAHAIQRLDEDPALLARLARGAHAAASRASVDRWADEILGRVDPGPHLTDTGVYTAW
jgi:glycosyltransferase involved in cell wall biosynthesis